MRLRIALITFVIAATAHAATYLVGTDRELIRSSAAIVVGTAGSSTSMRGPRGTIETVTRVHVEEAIAGPVTGGETIDVVELGGIVGTTGLAVAGSPRFTVGERVLLLLDKDADAAWTTRGMGLGRFTFVRDIAGRELLVRDEAEIIGWDPDGSAHQERRRAAQPFLDFVRETARGGNPPAGYFVPRATLIAAPDSIQTNAAPASTYCIQQGGTPIRWNSFPSPVVFLSNGSQPGATSGGVPAAQRGLASWTNDPGSNVVYQYGGTTNAKGGLQRGDGINSILFNDPNDEISGAFPKDFTLAIGGAWFDTSRTHSYNGEAFYTILEADLIVQNGIAGSGLTGNGFDHVLAHELGHTLGFRHSDDPPPGGTSTSNALMNSSVDFNFDPTGAALLAWDQEAAAAVYGGGSSGPPPCSAPVITAQPQSSDYHNAPVALTVTVAGTGPYSYRWYVGTRGDTRQPAANGTGPVLTVTPTQTTSYWVRVTGQCAPPADSDTATITVNGCPAIAINSITPSTSIIEGTPQPLALDATSSGHPLTIQWFAGAIGDTTRPVGSGANVTVTPQATQVYWAQIANDCGATATSELVTVTVTPCDKPVVIIQPANADVVSGTGAALSATIAGTQPLRFQWYEGTFPDTSRPVPNANTASFTTPSLFSGSTFWLQATNPCGEVATHAAVVNVVTSCTAPAIVVQPQNQFVAVGTSAILSVTAAGPSLTYAWYEGPVLDFTRPVGGSSPSLATRPITAPAQFWVRITNPCGEAKSVAATVSPATARRRSVGR